ncbi:torsin-1B-like [Phyllostomus discolor]|uniref:Torsin-1B-like n=1 Tax=Phyllostomus discolor TaxID=89673 RepID=A0A7E6EH75_9CHIR|nr:torsin-1B-like [Phyllostomus discolor]
MTQKTADTVADFLLNRIIPRFGLPSSIQSDNGPGFISQIVQQVSTSLGTIWKLHIPYHPQSPVVPIPTPLKVINSPTPFLLKDVPLLQDPERQLQVLAAIEPISMSLAILLPSLPTPSPEKLLGEHLAKEVILKALTGFKSNKDPKEPWTLSLCGWAGTGKNFVSQIVAENLHSKGLKNNFVHLFVSILHFPHEHQIKLYQDQLQRWIQGNVSACVSSVFIFDKMDKLNPRIRRPSSHLLDYYEQVGGVSYQEVIFIFLSMAGGDLITKTDLEFWRAGRKWEDIQLNNLEHMQSVGVFSNKHSGLWCSRLTDRNFRITLVPFCP